MNWQEVQGNWKQYWGKMREKWNRLSDADFDKIAGHRDLLVGRIQQTYGIAKDEAERQVREFERAAETTKNEARRPH